MKFILDMFGLWTRLRKSEFEIWHIVREEEDAVYVWDLEA